jgi:hypothetical protein
MAYPAVQYYPTLTHKRNDLRRKTVNERKMCFDILHNFLILRLQRDTILTVRMPSHTAPAIIVRFYCNFYLLNRVLKDIEISNFMKIRPVGAEKIHADERT